MNILFFTLVKTDLAEPHNIYADLARELIALGHTVKTVCPAGQETPGFSPYDGQSGTVYLKMPPVEKVGKLRKGLATLFLGRLILNGAKKAFRNETFDLILYSTPPITVEPAVRYFKRRDRAKAVLLLKDIFPQNAVDLGMISKTGVKGLIYAHFRRVEKRLYAVSDLIGCMSPANAAYLKAHNDLGNKPIAVLPNAFSDAAECYSPRQKADLRAQYGLPQDKRIFVYGGNIGAPQDVGFIEKCLLAATEEPSAHFVFCGSGTHFERLQRFAKQHDCRNLTVLSALPRAEFEKFVGCCDVGLIFLDHRFTIPNFPSRLLSYLQKSLPVLAATDRATDLKDAILDGGYGWWCESREVRDFQAALHKALSADLAPLGQNAAAALDRHYSAKKVAEHLLERIR